MEANNKTDKKEQESDQKTLKSALYSLYSSQGYSLDTAKTIIESIMENA